LSAFARLGARQFEWIPAFAGMTKNDAGDGDAGAQRPAVPQVACTWRGQFEWIPAFGGMTKTGLATVMLGRSVLRFRKSGD
jgi:hypothetical protein